MLTISKYGLEYQGGQILLRIWLDSDPVGKTRSDWKIWLYHSHLRSRNSKWILSGSTQIRWVTGKTLFLVRFSLILTHPFLIHSSEISCKPWKEKSVSLSMLGHQATAMRFWQLSLIISQMRGNVVSFQSVFIYIWLILS